MFGGNQATRHTPQQQATVMISARHGRGNPRLGCSCGDSNVLFKVRLAMVQIRHLESAVVERRVMSLMVTGRRGRDPAETKQMCSFITTD